MRVMSKFSDLFDSVSTCSKSSKDFADIGSFFHRNDSKLIFFVDPDKEGLILVVVDSSTGWPVSVESTRVKESVTFLEKEVISNELLLILL